MAKRRNAQICIVTVTGADRVGKIAKIATAMAKAKINILDVNQKIMEDYFVMIMASGNIGGLLGWAPVMKFPKTASPKFIARRGRIPSPVQALRN